MNDEVDLEDPVSLARHLLTFEELLTLENRVRGRYEEAKLVIQGLHAQHHGELRTILVIMKSAHDRADHATELLQGWKKQRGGRPPNEVHDALCLLEDMNTSPYLGLRSMIAELEMKTGG